MIYEMHDLENEGRWSGPRNGPKMHFLDYLFGIFLRDRCVVARIRCALVQFACVVHCVVAEDRGGEQSFEQSGRVEERATGG